MSEKDIEQKIKLTYETNADETSSQVNNLSGSLDKVDSSQEKVVKSTKETGKAHKETSAAVKKQSEALDGLGGSIGNAISSMKAMVKQLWLIIANPIVLTIVAIVGVLALMAKAFTNSFEGGEKVEQMMAGISATGQALIDNLEKIGSAIVKVFTLDFAGAKKEMQEVVASAENAYNKMAKLKKQQQQLNRDQADNDLEAIKRQATLADLKDKLLDDSISVANKKKIQQQLLKASEENAKSDLKLAKDIAENKIAMLTLEKDGAKKNYVEIQKIKAEQLKGEIANSQELKQIRRAGDSLDREQLANQKAIQAERAAVSKAAKDKALVERKEYLDKANKIEEENEKIADEKAKAERDKKKKEYEDGLAAQATKVQIEADIARNIEEEAKRHNEVLLQQEEVIQQAKLGLAQQGINLFSQIFGKSKKAQKAALLASNAVGLAEVVINTQKAVSADMAVPFGAGLPKVPIDIASGALGAASIIAATAKGLKDLGGSGEAGSAPNIRGGVSSGASAAPQVNFQASSENQIGNTLAGGINAQAPIRVTVLESDITKTQTAVTAKVVSNSF